MRLESKQPVRVKEKTIGGATPLVCLPLVAEDRAVLLPRAAELTALAPDLLEWRVDGFSRVHEVGACLDALKRLCGLTAHIPLIFTCRIDREGGMQSVSRDNRLELISRAVRTGLVDIADIELCNDPEFIDRVKTVCREHNTRLILSFHDFEKTPDSGCIIETLVRARDLGADIAKLAAMPKDFGDVLTLMNATLAARTSRIDIPMVTISMGELGVVSRISGGVFGSDITFAVGNAASAPGQIPIGDLRPAMSALYG